MLWLFSQYSPPTLRLPYGFPLCAPQTHQNSQTALSRRMMVGRLPSTTLTQPPQPRPRLLSCIPNIPCHAMPCHASPNVATTSSSRTVFPPFTTLARPPFCLTYLHIALCSPHSSPMKSAPKALLSSHRVSSTCDARNSCSSVAVS